LVADHFTSLQTSLRGGRTSSSLIDGTAIREMACYLEPRSTALIGL
jgi:hypothetical protein